MPPHHLEQLIAYNIRTRYEELIREISKDYYNDYEDILEIDVRNPHVFTLKYVPVENNLRFFINNIWYSSRCFVLNREKKKLQWIFTQAYGGFQIKPYFEVRALYDICLDDNSDLSSLSDIS